MSNNPTTRNHYLPQFCLREFADSAGKVMRTFRRPDNGKLLEGRFVPKSIGYEKDLYSLEPVFDRDSAIQADEIERQFFSPIDNNAAKAIKGLIDRGPSSLNDDEKLYWAIFLNSLLERTPTVLDAQDATAERIGREWLDNFIEKYSAYPEALARWSDILARFRAQSASRNAVRYAMCARIGEKAVIDYFLKCNWVVLKMSGPQDAHFITSNVPVVVNAGSPGAIEALTLSLSPECLFALYRSNEITEQVIFTLSRIHNLKVFEQSMFVYSRLPLYDGEYAKARTAAEELLIKPGDWNVVR